MKSAGTIILGIWCAVTFFVSPVWLTMTFLDITGLIYQYDGFVDEGTAGIMGVIELVLWIVIVLLPDIWFVKRMKPQGWRRVLYAMVSCRSSSSVNKSSSFAVSIAKST